MDYKRVKSGREKMGLYGMAIDFGSAVNIGSNAL